MTKGTTKHQPDERPPTLPQPQRALPPLNSPTPPQPEPLVTIGTIGRPHGVLGDLKIFLANPTSQTLSTAPEVTLRVGDKAPQTLRIQSAKPANKCWIVRLNGISDRDAAAALTGATCSVARQHLPATTEDEFYYVDLIGFSVISHTDQRPLGHVIQIFHNGAHEVLIYGPSTRQAEMIPFMAPFVAHVDTSLRTLHILPLDFDDT